MSSGGPTRPSKTSRRVARVSPLARPASQPNHGNTAATDGGVTKAKTTTSRSTMTSPQSSDSDELVPGCSSSSSSSTSSRSGLLGRKRRAHNSNEENECGWRRRRTLDALAFEEIVRLAHSASSSSSSSNSSPPPPPLGSLTALSAAQAFALEQLQLRGWCLRFWLWIWCF